MCAGSATEILGGQGGSKVGWEEIAVKNISFTFRSTSIVPVSYPGTRSAEDAMLAHTLPVVDFPLVIAVLIQVTKVLEVLIPGSQQEWIKNKTNDLASLLSNIKPLDWFRILQGEHARVILMWIGLCIYFLLVLSLSVALTILVPTLLPPSPTLVIALGISLVLNVFFFKTFAMQRYGAPLIKWLYAEGIFHIFVRRFLKFLCIYFPAAAIANVVIVIPAYLVGVLEGKKLIGKHVSQKFSCDHFSS
ncbi:MAG: hypothetical protein JO232_06770 [Verrucomicrobia bacterium]|nr:hypothetical protein [Verrucomicrobiota bacterium]